MENRFIKARRAAVVAAMAGTLVGATACGVILYPERKGQVDGRIDPAVAVLDGIGLLFFIVPGVIAFAVDFATGAIYLPGTSASTTLDMDDADMVKLDRRYMDAALIEKSLREQTGQAVSLADPALLARRADGADWQALSQILSATQYAELTGSRMRAAAD